MRRSLAFGLLGICLLLAGLAAAFYPASGSGAKIKLAGSPGLDVHVISQTKSTVKVGWTATTGGLGYTFGVGPNAQNVTRVSNTWDPTATWVQFGIRSGSNVYAVQEILPGPSGSVTVPAVTTTTTTTTTSTTTTVSTTTVTTTTTPTTTVSGSLDMGALYLAATPNSTVVVPCGSYGDQTILGQNAGPVIFQAAQPHCVTIGNLQLGQNNGSTSGNAPSNLTVDGIDVHGTVFGWYADPTGGSLGPDHFILTNSHVWDTTNGGRGIYLFSFRNALIQDVEVGPLCCNSDGIDMAIPRFGAPSPYGITLNRVNVHDVYDSCALLTVQLPGTACSGQGFESGCATCEHPDGTQWYGGNNSIIENSSFTRINPGGTAAQGIFVAQANGGVMNNFTIQNNTLGPTANNTLSISGPGQGYVTGTILITGNIVHGNIRMYGASPSVAPFNAPVTITVSNNTADVYQTDLNSGCSLYLSNGTIYTPSYSGNTFGNGQCQ